MTPEITQLTKLNYSIQETATLIGICRAKIYQEIKAGRMPVLKSGTRTLVPAKSIQQWIGMLSSKS